MTQKGTKEVDVSTESTLQMKKKLEKRNLILQSASSSNPPGIGGGFHPSHPGFPKTFGTRMIR